MSHPSESLDGNAVSRTRISEKQSQEFYELWRPKRPLTRAQTVATFGSCFAQSLGPALRKRGYSWFDAEPSPEIFLPAIQKKYNYGVFSARTGNIYTAAALKQWVSWALGINEPPDEIWERNGRFIDPFRPSIEPDGFDTPEGLLASRSVVLRAIRNVAQRADLLVFTLDHNEGWINLSNGYEYALCPGSIAGNFNPDNHALRKYTLENTIADLTWVIKTISAMNGKIHFLLTVSALALTAAMSRKRVLTASQPAKSLLCAVARITADNLPIVDYFPSYEILTTPSEIVHTPNKQKISRSRKQFVMDSFFSSNEHTRVDEPTVESQAPNILDNDDLTPNIFWNNVLLMRRFLLTLM